MCWFSKGACTNTFELNELIWLLIRSFASRSITGPISVVIKLGRPIFMLFVAPNNIFIVLSYTSSWIAKIRRAEHRWPAPLKPDSIASSTTCSVKAEESIIIKFNPPVSAARETISPFRSVKSFCIFFAVSHEPVKTTPLILSSFNIFGPIVSPSPNKSWSEPGGSPAFSKSFTIS